MFPSGAEPGPDGAASGRGTGTGIGAGDGHARGRDRISAPKIDDPLFLGVACAPKFS